MISVLPHLKPHSSIAIDDRVLLEAPVVVAGLVGFWANFSVSLRELVLWRRERLCGAMMWGSGDPHYSRPGGRRYT